MAGLKKYAKKMGRKVVKAAKKRYVKNGSANIANITKDVMYLKSVLNPEKKIFQYTATDQVVGQCSANVSAFYVKDITPLPSQGTTSVTRNGNSLRLSSSYFKFQLQQQSANIHSDIRFRFIVVKVLGTPFTGGLGSNLVPNMFNANSFITGGSIIDYNSDRNTQSFKNYVILREKRITLPANQQSSQHMLRTFSFGMRYKSHHVKFTTDGSNAISDGQLVLIVLADNGNCSTSSASTLAGTQATAVNTGALLQEDITHYFYDN